MKRTVNLAELNASNGLKIFASQSRQGSDYSVSYAGDFNNDGIDDVIIGDSRQNKSYVVFGSANFLGDSIDVSDLSGLNGFSIIGEESGDIYPVSGAGDINDDGIDDIIIGAPNTTGLRWDQGVVGGAYVVFGKRNWSEKLLNVTELDGSNGFKLNSLYDGGRLGSSLSSAGDLNGDGINDVIIGVPYADSFAGYESGAARILLGSPDLSAASLSVGPSYKSGTVGINGFARYSEFGNSVASAGDFNGDGIDDVVIGAPKVGRSYVVFGSVENLAIGQSGPFEFFGGTFSGISVSSAGDFNNDGIDDIIVGGVVTHIVFGSNSRWGQRLDASELNGANGFKITGVNNPFSVSSAGDINADGINDLIIGVRGAGAQWGESYVVFGASGWSTAILDLSNIDESIGFAIEGYDPSTRSGFSTSTAGDFNGDGVDDVIIGTGKGSVNGTFSPDAYVVFGESSKTLPKIMIVGFATEDETLTTVTDTLVDDDGVGELSYQWKADGEDISAATAETLTLSQDEVGKEITVAVSYTDGGGTIESVTSAATAPVANVNDNPMGLVEIRGTAAEYQTITAVTDTLADDDGLGTLNYQWLRDGSEIKGATQSSYILTQEDVGSQISLSVSYTDGQGTDESISSVPTAPVEAVLVIDPAFDIVLASTSGDVATFEVYATDVADSGDPGLEDFQFVLSHDVADMAIDGGSFVTAAGLSAFPNLDQINGTLNFGGFALPPFTALSTPILKFNATILNEEVPFSVIISDIIADDTNMPSVEQQFDFSSVAVESTVVGRGGQALSDVRVSYDFVTPSGQEQSLELPIQAASKVSHAMARGSDMNVTAEKAIDEASDKSITANDALQALRLAVGLTKSDGKAEWHDYIAADINKDGQVTANDALNILKFAVGLTDGPSADWVFVDGDADWSTTGRRNSSYEEGIWLEDVVDDMSVNMTGILVGDVNGSYVA